VVDPMDRRLCDSTQSAEQLRSRAHELRAEAEQSDVSGIRNGLRVGAASVLG
jgi:hypothetical protein